MTDQERNEFKAALRLAYQSWCQEVWTYLESEVVPAMLEGPDEELWPENAIARASTMAWKNRAERYLASRLGS